MVYSVTARFLSPGASTQPQVLDSWYEMFVWTSCVYFPPNTALCICHTSLVCAVVIVPEALCFVHMQFCKAQMFLQTEEAFSQRYPFSVPLIVPS